MLSQIIAAMSDESPKFKYAPPRHHVREWRKFRQLTQEKLAEQAQFTTGAISQLETGRTAYTQDMLEALASALKCKAGDLISANPFASGTSREGQLRSALLAYGVDRDDLDATLRAIRGFVSDHHDDEQPQSDRPRDQSGRASRRREPTP